MAGDGGRSLLDRIFGALSNARRRFVLYQVRERGPTDEADLATVVAAWEQGVPAEAVSAETSREVRIDLRHVHLPKLEDYGLVEYDRRSGTVCYSYPPNVLDDIVDLAGRVENYQ